MGYNISIQNDFLKHHGILGQKWGKRNGPPYPLDASDHSAAEKKANPSLNSESIEERKKRILSQDDPEVLAKNLDLPFTFNELNEWCNRIDKQKTIRKLAEEKRKKNRPWPVKAADFALDAAKKGLKEATENEIKNIVKSAISTTSKAIQSNPSKVKDAIKEAAEEAKKESDKKNNAKKGKNG